METITPKNKKIYLYITLIVLLIANIILLFMHTNIDFKETLRNSLYTSDLDMHKNQLLELEENRNFLEFHAYRAGLDDPYHDSLETFAYINPLITSYNQLYYSLLDIRYSPINELYDSEYLSMVLSDHINYIHSDMIDIRESTETYLSDDDYAEFHLEVAEDLLAQTYILLQEHLSLTDEQLTSLATMDNEARTLLIQDVVTAEINRRSEME